MRDDLAPVIPLFGGAASAAPAERGAAPADSWHTTWTAPVDRGADPAARADADAAAQDAAPDVAEIAAAAEAALLRRLRTRSLSIREARAVLRERELDEASVDALVERFVGNGYLDDARLAEQLIHSGVERKGQGRLMLSQALGKRGIPREVIDAALAELPDDEAERALAFARQKARSLQGLDRDTALRRLSGQLARRGYGSVALSAARQALDEAARPPARGVRFE
ncbi:MULTISPECIES: regulatory protein RecX [Microbacterium]|uniref:regulatory protein RecX n=1 Tax=Microbacterium TaxID=33882 RepID=UPI001EF5FD2C|nr:regulatory protein RecX [Microbacterium aurum]MCG7413991.1 RecX family transcriptional regulator [Microbacterium aurum]